VRLRNGVGVVTLTILSPQNTIHRDPRWRRASSLMGVYKSHAAYATRGHRAENVARGSERVEDVIARWKRLRGITKTCCCPRLRGFDWLVWTPLERVGAILGARACKRARLASRQLCEGARRTFERGWSEPCRWL
jgi:hypothetical protein